MAVFLTGATGFLGSYLAAELLRESSEPLALLVRSRNFAEARERLWRSLQLHFSFEEFDRHCQERVQVFLGDITKEGLGLDGAARKRLISSADSIIHCAASLHRRSYEICFNANLRGTLEVLQLAQQIHGSKGLRRFSQISSVAVSGRRKDENVTEDMALRWNAPDMDPYGATKKISEFMATKMLGDAPVTVFRPSAIIGDSRFAKTTQFDMVRALALLAKSPVLPLSPDWRIDIVPADFVARAIVKIHLSPRPSHGVYQVSAGVDSPTYGQIVTSIATGNGRRYRFMPRLEPRFARLCAWLSNRHSRWKVSRLATLIHVFLPHLLANTTYDNVRLRQELGETAPRFENYVRGLVEFAAANDFKFPYLPYPGKAHREVA